METPLAHPQRGEAELASTDPVTIEAEDLFITSPEGKTLAGPLNFTLPAGQRAVLVGRSGSGKSSLLNALSGFLSYQGSLRINGIELRDLSPESWRKHLSGLGKTHNYRQQHYGITYYWHDLMPANTSYKQRWITHGSVSFYRSCHKALIRLLATKAARLSVGQAQRGGGPSITKSCSLLLLDEPAASLDAHSEQRVMEALNAASLRQTTLMVTHQLEDLADWDVIWVMQDGQIIEQGRYAELSVAGGPFSTLLAHRQEEI